MLTFMLAAAAVIAPAPPSSKIVVMNGKSYAAANCPIANAKLTSGMIDAETAKGFHTLDREPASQAYLTVARKIEGCDVPMVVPSVLTAGR